MAVQPTTPRSDQRPGASSNDQNHARGFRQAKRWDAPDENLDPNERSGAYAFTDLGKEEEGLERTEQEGDGGERSDDMQQDGSQRPRPKKHRRDREDDSRGMPDGSKEEQEKPAQQEGEKTGGQGLLNEEEAGAPEQQARQQDEGLFSRWQRHQEIQERRQSSLREQVQQAQNVKLAAGKQIAAAAKGVAAKQAGSAAVGAAVKRGLLGLALRNPYVIGVILMVVLPVTMFFLVQIAGTAYFCYTDKGLWGNLASVGLEIVGFIDCPYEPSEPVIYDSKVEQVMDPANQRASQRGH